MSTIKRRKKIIISTQRKNITKKEKHEAEKIRKTPEPSVFLLAIYGLGILGIFTGINDMLKLSFPILALIAAVFLILTGVLWYIFFYKRKYFLHITILLIGIIVALVGITISNPFYVHSLETMDAEVPVTTAVMVLLVLIYILFSLEFVLRKHSLLFLICAAVVMLGPLVNIRLNIFSIVCIVIFQFGFIALNMTDRSYKKIFNVKSRPATAAVTVVVIAVMLLVSMVPAVIIEKANETTLFRQVYQADAYFQDLLLNMDIGLNSGFMDGVVSRGNNHQTGEKMLDFYVSKQPEDTTYLAHFRGKNYDYSGWDPAMSLQMSEVNGDTPSYREPFIEDIFRTMLHDGSIDTYGYNLPSGDSEKFAKNRQAFVSAYYNYLNTVIGYDDKGNYYYMSEMSDMLICRTPEQRSGDSDDYTIVEESLSDVKTNLCHERFFIWVDDKTNEVLDFYINENLDCFYYEYNPVTAIQEPVFIDKEVAKKRYYSLGGNPDMLYDTSYWYDNNIELDGKNYYFLTDYDLYVAADENLNVTVYADKDAVYSDDGFVINNSTLQTAMHDIYNTLMDSSGKRKYVGLLGNSFSSDLVSDIYTSFGPMGRMSYSDDTSGYRSPNSFYVEYPDYDNGNRIALPYYSTINTGRVMFDGINEGEFYTVNDIDMSPLWKQKDIEFMPLYDHFISLYEQYARLHYTAYDESRLPNLTKLCRETPLDTVDEVTTFILYTLQNHASYTKTPGSVPFNKDTVEYFLFENHRGYCVHFASAAALMYRMYGIPARYVTGYAVNAGNFKPYEKNQSWYKSEVTDYSAHAWVEIFLRDYGWVQIEATPSALGVMETEYPGYDRNEMMRIMDEHGWKFRDVQDFMNNTADNNDDNNNAIGWLNNSGYGWVILVGSIVLVIGGTVAFFLLRRNYLLNRMPQMSCRRLFDRMMRSIHFSGRLKDMNGSELDFAEKLCAAVPELNRKETDQMIDILLIENYSEEGATEQQHAAVMALGQKLSGLLYERLKWYKKPVYKFIKALI